MRAILLFCFCTAVCQGAALFNGRNLDGWVHEGPQHTFSAEADELRCSGRGHHPNWLRTEREYENFRLTFEYKLAQWAEAAVILRAPRTGRPIRSGLALYLAHDFHHQTSSYVTGAIAGVLPPRKARPESWGAWHSVAITLDGDRFTAAIDGELVQEVVISSEPQLELRLKRGFIGFPDLGHAYAVRNLQIEDLGFRHKFVDLLAGGTLEGWALRGAGSWSVRDGVIAGANGHGILYAPPVLRDFELTALVRSHNRANGGIFLRGSAKADAPRGFEVQIYSPPDSVFPTGSIYGRVRAESAGDFEERWFLMQIRVRGRTCIVRLDGDTVARTDDLGGVVPEAGQVGLQIHMENTSVEWRDLRVRPL